MTSVSHDAFAFNNLTSVSIGDNVELDYGGGSDVYIAYPSFDREFIEYYNSTGKHAGTYVLRDGQWRRDE